MDSNIETKELGQISSEELKAPLEQKILILFFILIIRIQKNKIY